MPNETSLDYLNETISYTFNNDFSHCTEHHGIDEQHVPEDNLTFPLLYYPGFVISTLVGVGMTVGGVYCIKNDYINTGITSIVLGGLVMLISPIMALQYIYSKNNTRSIYS